MAGDMLPSNSLKPLAIWLCIKFSIVAKLFACHVLRWLVLYNQPLLHYGMVQ